MFQDRFTATKSSWGLVSIFSDSSIFLKDIFPSLMTRLQLTYFRLEVKILWLCFSVVEEDEAETHMTLITSRDEHCTTTSGHNHNHMKHLY